MAPPRCMLAAVHLCNFAEGAQSMPLSADGHCAPSVGVVSLACLTERVVVHRPSFDALIHACTVAQGTQSSPLWLCSVCEQLLSWHGTADNNGPWAVAVQGIQSPCSAARLHWVYCRCRSGCAQCTRRSSDGLINEGVVVQGIQRRWRRWWRWTTAPSPQAAMMAVCASCRFR